jgi:hypothetical protein
MVILTLGGQNGRKTRETTVLEFVGAAYSLDGISQGFWISASEVINRLQQMSKDQIEISGSSTD